MIYAGLHESDAAAPSGCRDTSSATMLRMDVASDDDICEIAARWRFVRWKMASDKLNRLKGSEGKRERERE